MWFAVTGRSLPPGTPTRGLLFAGDVRLYNRAELISELGRPTGDAEPSDLELARLAYARWNDAAPRHLIGDFAFAAWNERTQTLFAARDHLGLAPFTTACWRTEWPSPLMCASCSLCSTGLSIRSTTARSETGSRWRFAIRGERFSRGSTACRPGIALICDAGGSHESRYWSPPSEPREAGSYEETCERLRETFRRAVRDRLESDHPIIAHSSGGFDSSTIVMMADAIYRSEPMRPPLTTASALARGMESDDSRYMDAVADRVAFQSVRWNVVEETPPDFPGVTRSKPALRIGLGEDPSGTSSSRGRRTPAS